MPNSADHIRQAKHNEEFYQVIDKNVYSDWAMTALFYAALHYIDAFLDRVGVDPAIHDDRSREVWDRKELRPIHSQYQALKNRSIYARYDCGRFNLDQLQLSCGRDLAAIRKAVLPLVSPK